MPLFMKKHTTLHFALVISSLWAMTSTMPAHAIGADSDGWITPETPLGIIYQSHQQIRQMYANGSMVDSNALFRGDATLFRVLYPVKLSEHWLWTPNLLLPWVNLRTGGNISQLGSASGFGDLAFVSGFWRKFNDRTHLAIVPFVWFPTGKYDRNAALNPGENRYRFALQIGAQVPLGESPFDLAGSFDITGYGRNKDTDTRQSVMMEWSGWVKYNLPSSMGAHFGLGMAHVYGGESRVSGIHQNDRASRTMAKLQFGTLLDNSKSNHLLFTFARDIKIENGLRVNQHFEIRYLHAF